MTTPNPVTEAAQRAAERICKLFDLKYSGDSAKVLDIIAAEFAPLVARVAAGDRLSDALKAWAASPDGIGGELFEELLIAQENSGMRYAEWEVFKAETKKAIEEAK